MPSIIEKNKKEIIILIALILLIPTLLYVEEIIFTFGQHIGTILRMYIEGVC